MNDPTEGKWSRERAWAWYDALPWIRGYNGLPSHCVNRIALWQEYGHEEVFREVEENFALARETGFNAVRTIVQFECWKEQHAAFLRHLEEYMTLAAKYGLGVMLTLGNDCTVPLGRWKPAAFGEQKVDWGYHSGIKTGPHTGDYSEPGYQLLDDPAIEPLYYEMVDELASLYAKDPRLQIWDVWNEIGNSNRGAKSVRAMENFFAILRAHDPIQPLTADVWSYKNGGREPATPEQERAAALSDVITYHGYMAYPDLVVTTEALQERYGRPLINNEWLNRILGNNVAEIYPFFYKERIGSYPWGLIAGYSQTYEPWGGLYAKYMEEGSTLDVTKWQHDLYRFNGLPYDKREIALMKRFAALDGEREARKKKEQK